MTRSTRGEFWNWSLERYARSGVEQKLLQLQDAFGLNVNVALWTCWCAMRFESMAETELRNAIELTARWSDHVTKPLRGVRRHLKGTKNNEVLREQIKDAELKSEKAEQTMLETFAYERLRAIVGDDGRAIDRARQNLASYATIAGNAAPDGELSSLLESLAGHIFGEPPYDAALGD